MSSLSITLIDVGWGDSIFLEARDDSGASHYGLIDSNDTTYFRSSYIFLKKYFDRKNLQFPDDKPIFDFVMLSHAHADHGQGLKALMREFGTHQFWYPKSINWSGLADLLRFANSSTNVGHHQSIDDSKILPAFGGVSVEVLWPRYGVEDKSNENNNSIVLVLRLGTTAFILSGDAEGDVWDNIASRIPQDTCVFKIPHHGSVNGTFDANEKTPWVDSLTALQGAVQCGISSHIKPFKHPHQRVIDLLNSKGLSFFRTDQNYHLTFSTDGDPNSLTVKYSHVSEKNE